MYKFEVKLYPELLKNRELLELSTADLENIFKIAENYNSVCKNAPNKKIIDLESLKIEDSNTIVFVLSSEQFLQFPTKAVRYFISNLSKIKPFKNLITPNGRLFKGESNLLENDFTEQNQHLNTDEEIFIALSKLFFRNTDKNREIIKKIKNILLEDLEI